MRSNYKIWIASSAVMAAALSCAWLPDVAEAASADVKLSPKTVTLQMKVTAQKTTYDKKKIKVKKAKGVTIKKVTYKSGNKSVATGEEKRKRENRRHGSVQKGRKDKEGQVKLRRKGQAQGGGRHTVEIVYNLLPGRGPQRRRNGQQRG